MDMMVLIMDCETCLHKQSYGIESNGDHVVQCANCGKRMFVTLNVRKAREETDYRDPVWLRREYVDNFRTMAEIAADFGVTPMTINSWLNKHDIPTRSRGHRKRV